MCSFAVQIIYGIIGTVVLGCTITSLAMDAWTKVSETDYSGILCPKDKLEAVMKGEINFADACPFDFSNFTNISPAQQAILLAIILAIVAEVFCLTYNFFTACACCCKTILLPVLCFLSLISAALLGIVVGVYLNQNSDRLKELEDFAEEVGKTGINTDFWNLGNSFIFAAIAFIGAVMNTLVSFVAYCCAATLL